MTDRHNGGSNGLAFDAQGRLIPCMYGDRGVVPDVTANAARLQVKVLARGQGF